MLDNFFAVFLSQLLGCVTIDVSSILDVLSNLKSKSS